MTKSLLSLITFASLFISTLSFASTNRMHLEVSKNTSKMLSISLHKVEMGEVIKLINTEGEVIFSEKINKHGHYKKSFSLSKLPYGLYFVENIASNAVNIKPIMVDKYRASLIDEASKEYIAPKISYKNHLLEVSAKNNKRAETFIDIYNSEGIMIYSSDTLKTNFIRKSFETFTLKGEYIRVSVTIDGYNFDEKISL